MLIGAIREKEKRLFQLEQPLFYLSIYYCTLELKEVAGVVVANVAYHLSDKLHLAGG